MGKRTYRKKKYSKRNTSKKRTLPKINSKKRYSKKRKRRNTRKKYGGSGVAGAEALKLKEGERRMRKMEEKRRSGHIHPTSGAPPEDELSRMIAKAQVEGQWVEYKDPQGRPYYYNTATKETTWDNPQAEEQDDSALSPESVAERTLSEPASPPSSPDQCMRNLKDVLGKLETVYREIEDLREKLSGCGEES